MTDAERLAEYQEYYRARAARYATNPLYPHTAAAERELADAVEASTSLADMQQRVVGGGLSLRCGLALARDQATARAALYARTGDDVRAQAPAEVLAGLGSVSDAAGLAALGAAAEQRAGHAVTVDELTRLWTLSIVFAENVEVWQHARVPERWRGELDGYVAEAVSGGRASWAEVVAGGRQQDPAWHFDPDTARAPRHRRLVPFPDEAFETRLAHHVQLVSGGAG